MIGSRWLTSGAPLARISKWNRCIEAARTHLTLLTAINRFAMSSSNKHEDEKRVSTQYITSNKLKPVVPVLMGNIVRLEYLLSNYKQYLDKTVEVAGWVKSCRKSGNGEFAFIEISDGSSMDTLQLVVFKSADNWEEITKLKTAACIRAKGTVVPSMGKNQQVELTVEGSKDGSYLKILGKNDDDRYPLAAKFHKVETLRQYAHLRPRTNLISAIARVKNSLAFATHNFFQQNGFYYVHTPIITTSDCEGAG